MVNIEQLTDAQLSEAVCKALGIEPLKYALGWESGPTLFYPDPNLRQMLVDKDAKFAEWPRYEIYPNVLDWPGFGRVVERLAELYPQSLLDLTRDPIYGYTCKLTIGGVPCKRCFCDTLPRALALAVLEWKARRG